MARIVTRSRLFFLGVAFVCVMTGTGGLIGAIGGVLLALVVHTVLGLASSVVLFMSTSAGLGAVVAMLLGIILMARQSPLMALRPHVNAAPSETN
jgi:ABC-type antimicrobial peptide transport system permease subunit